jgi:uncharacterized membrane protein YtjA (UPF0391 family)
MGLSPPFSHLTRLPQHGTQPAECSPSAFECAMPLATGERRILMMVYALIFLAAACMSIVLGPGAALLPAAVAKMLFMLSMVAAAVTLILGASRR